MSFHKSSNPWKMSQMMLVEYPLLLLWLGWSLRVTSSAAAAFRRAGPLASPLRGGAICSAGAAPADRGRGATGGAECGWSVPPSSITWSRLLRIFEVLECKKVNSHGQEYVSRQQWRNDIVQNLPKR